MYTCACTLYTYYYKCMYSTSKNLLKSDSSVSLCGTIASGRSLNQHLMKGLNPNILGSRYTIPHLLTVAGLATARSWTSNIIVIASVSLMISPLLRQSFLLSSRTVFMFSIQTASTGPSNTYHFLSVVPLATPWRTRAASIPSVLQQTGNNTQSIVYCTCEWVMLPHAE